MAIEPLKVNKGEPPVGYGFVGIFEKKEDAIKWYKAARKAGKIYPMYLTYREGYYTLWRLKPKGGGKMVGVGFDRSKMQHAEQRRK
jgi:hypothetical protein